jgi:hypothetical protein
MRMEKRVCVGLLAVSLIAACKGSDGTNGAQGPAGSLGPTGPAGIAGTMGSKGDPGQNGSTGSMGTKGATGTPGMMGPPGATITLSERATVGFHVSPVPIVNTATATQDQLEAIGLGSYIVNAVVGCNDCHQHLNMAGPPDFMAGGQPFVIPVGPAATATVHARNLTPDPTTGLVHDVHSADDFVTVFRTGADMRTGHTNESLLVMPWPTFRWMKDSDIKAIYAYLRHIPAVVNMVADDTGRPAVPPLPFPMSYNEGDVVRPLPDPTAPDPNDFSRGLAISPLDDQNAGNFNALPVDLQGLYARGSYIVNAQSGCNDCHTNPPRSFAPGPNYLQINTAQFLSGGAVFAVPPGLNIRTHTRRTMGADLTGGNNGFSDGFKSFMGIITEGSHVEDNPPRPVAFPMPWQHFRYMTIGDLEAVFTYVTNLPRRTGANDKLAQPPALYCDANVTCPNGQTCFMQSMDGLGPGGECYKSTCTTNADCGACQTCGGLGCAPPVASNRCPSQGI